MTASKTSRSRKAIEGAFAPRAIGDGDPPCIPLKNSGLSLNTAKSITTAWLRAARLSLLRMAQKHFAGGSKSSTYSGGLPERLRNRPTGQTTKDAILVKLERIGISCSERTLARDYDAIGGTKALRAVKPFAPGEDTSSPFLPVTGKASR